MPDLRSIRKSLSLTLAQVAKATDTTPVTISRYERGLRLPSVKMARKLAKVYKLRWVDFFKDV